MKKIISLLLAGASCLIALTACSGEKTASGSTGNSGTSSSSGIQEVAVGEPFQVDAKYGSYILTITGMEETDWWNRKYKNDKKSVVLLNYEVENISFSSILSEGVHIEADLFKITDSSKGTLTPFLWYYDDIGPADTVVPGEKQSGSLAYIRERDSEYYDVTFTRVSGEVAKIRVDM
jgi:hypothetical protein